DQLILITPEDHLAIEENRYYRSQQQAENTSGDFICHTQDEAQPLEKPRSFSPLLAKKRFGSMLQHYQLALSADYAYHQKVGNSNLDATYSEMANAVSRINFVF